MLERIRWSEGHTILRDGEPVTRRRLMKGFWRFSFRAMGAWFLCVIGGGILGTPAMGWATELHFVIRDVADERAAWFPREVSLHYWSAEFTEPLTFRLENPTARTHVFEAPGLFEQVEEGGGLMAKPVRITIAPEETLRIQIDRERLAEDVIGSEEGARTYRFYCPLHRGDADTASTLLVVP